MVKKKKKKKKNVWQHHSDFGRENGQREVESREQRERAESRTTGVMVGSNGLGSSG